MSNEAEREACNRIIKEKFGFPPSQLCMLSGRDIEWAFQAGAEWQRSQQSAPVIVPGGWQPIETAPHDNKHPLYLARFDEQGDLMELDFDGVWEYWEESWEMSHINGYDWCSANGIEEPTHWAYMAAQTDSAKGGSDGKDLK